VYIPRRDTNSRLNRLAGGRLFPGVHHAARFEIEESLDAFQLDMRSNDGEAFVRVRARVADQIAASSVFLTLDQASQFFLGGALGWSARSLPGEYDGLELRCSEWKLEPLTVYLVESSFFTNENRFPRGTAQFDSAFLMRGLAHKWIARGRMEKDGGVDV